LEVKRELVKVRVCVEMRGNRDGPAFDAAGVADLQARTRVERTMRGVVAMMLMQIDI
jgi:hypothetical protein